MSVAVKAEKPVRKFPPPCWTRDEALVLIEAYRERWYELNRAYLRTADWDAVADKVVTSCPDVTPPKTPAQCRHKMEKLRQRHRAEKQRASSFPGRFFSTWFYFQAMEAMENGSESGNQPISSELIVPNPTPTQTPVSGHQGLNPGRGIRFKPSSVQNLVTLATSSTKHGVKPSPNFNSRASNHYSSSFINNGSNQEDEFEDGYLVDAPIDETLIPPPGYRSRSGGIRMKTSLPHQDSARPGLRPRKFSKVVHDVNEEDDNGERWIKAPRSTNSNPFGRKFQNEKKPSPSFEIGKKKGVAKKENGDAIGEVVSSIKLLGDGFMKMERMKMDMAREIEKMRMEAEMKRNQLILETQKQIVDAFLKGLMENDKQTAMVIADP